MLRKCCLILSEWPPSDQRGEDSERWSIVFGWYLHGRWSHQVSPSFSAFAFCNFIHFFMPDFFSFCLSHWGKLETTLLFLVELKSLRLMEEWWCPGVLTCTPDSRCLTEAWWLRMISTRVPGRLWLGGQPWSVCDTSDRLARVFSASLHIQRCCFGDYDIADVNAIKRMI